MSYASDTFVGTGALSANWQNQSGAASRVVGKVTPTIAPAAYTWNPATNTFSADQFSTVMLTGVPGSQVGATVRYNSGLSGYVVVASAAGTLIVYRSDSGSLTALETLSGYTFANGNTIGIEIVGSNIRAFYNGTPQGAGSSDATYSAAAAPGWLLGSLADTLDFWEAQDVIADPIGLPTLMQNTGWLALITM